MPFEYDLVTDEDWNLVKEYLIEGTYLVEGISREQATQKIAEVKQRITNVISTKAWCEDKGRTHANFIPETREDCLNILVWTILNKFHNGQDLDGHARKIYGGYVRDWIMRGDQPNDVDFQLSQAEYMLSFSPTDKQAFFLAIQTEMENEWKDAFKYVPSFYIRKAVQGQPYPNGNWDSIPNKALQEVNFKLFRVTENAGAAGRPGMMSFFVSSLTDADPATMHNPQHSDYGLPGIHVDCQRKNFLQPNDPGTPGDVDNLALIGNQGDAACWLGLKKFALVHDTSPFSSLALSIYHAMTKQFVYYKDPRTGDGVERADRLTGRRWQCLNWNRTGTDTIHIFPNAVGVLVPKTCGTYVRRERYPNFTHFAILQNPHGAAETAISQFNLWESTCVLPPYIEDLIEGNYAKLTSTKPGFFLDPQDQDNLIGWCFCFEKMVFPKIELGLLNDYLSAISNLTNMLLVKFDVRPASLSELEYEIYIFIENAKSALETENDRESNTIHALIKLQKNHIVKKFWPTFNSSYNMCINLIKKRYPATYQNFENYFTRLISKFLDAQIKLLEAPAEAPAPAAAAPAAAAPAAAPVQHTGGFKKTRRKKYKKYTKYSKRL
jgi:hypothetical protein